MNESRGNTVIQEFIITTGYDLGEILIKAFYKTCKTYSLEYNEKDNSVEIYTADDSNYVTLKKRSIYLYGEDSRITVLVSCICEGQNTYNLEIDCTYKIERGCSKLDKIISNYFLEELSRMGVTHVCIKKQDSFIENVANIVKNLQSPSPVVTVKFKKLNPKAIPFSYTRKNDACMDMYALDSGILTPGETRIVYTGIAIEIPEGYEGIVRGRSGLASRGIFVHIGTVDFEYRGDIGIIMSNFTKKDFYIQGGMRLGQFTVKPVYRCNLIEVQELSETERGSNGYGSTNL